MLNQLARQQQQAKDNLLVQVLALCLEVRAWWCGVKPYLNMEGWQKLQDSRGWEQSNSGQQWPGKGLQLGNHYKHQQLQRRGHV